MSCYSDLLGTGQSMASYSIRPKWCSGKESTCQCRKHSFDPWIRKIPWRRKWQPTVVFLPGKSHGQEDLADYSLWSRKVLDTTEWVSIPCYWGKNFLGILPNAPWIRLSWLDLWTSTIPGPVWEHCPSWYPWLSTLSPEFGESAWFYLGFPLYSGAQNTFNQ